MAFLERFDNARRLWEFSVSQVPVPPNQSVIGWLVVYSDNKFETAVVQMSHRIRNCTAVASPFRVSTNPRRTRCRWPDHVSTRRTVLGEC